MLDCQINQSSTLFSCSHIYTHTHTHTHTHAGVGIYTHKVLGKCPEINRLARLAAAVLMRQQGQQEATRKCITRVIIMKNDFKMMPQTPAGDNSDYITGDKSDHGRMLNDCVCTDLLISVTSLTAV